jgi:hypothetical protein
LAVPYGGTAGRIRLANHRIWRPTKGKKVNLNEVEEYILEMDETLGLEFCGFDPWQMESMAQRLEADSEHRRRSQKRRFESQPWMRAIPPTAANLRQQCTLTREGFADGRFLFYECDPLRSDLKKLRVEEQSYGERLISPKDRDGHGDTFSAFANALVIAHEVAGKKPVVAGAVDLDRPSMGFQMPGEAYAEQTPEERNAAVIAAREDFDLERYLYSVEMRELSKQNDEHEQWKDLMRRMGRL